MKAILVRIGAVIAVLVFSVGMTVVLGIYQTVYPEKIVSAERPEALGLDYEDVNLYTSDGLRIAGWYIPKEGAPSDSVVIVLHGYPTEKGDLLRRSAFLLADHDLFLIDFRFFGASEGDQTTLGLKEIEDLRAAVRYVKDEKKKAKVGVYGFSMGASVALRGIVEVPGIDAVVAEAPYADLHIMARELYRSFGPFAGFFAGLTARAAELFLHFDLNAASPLKAVEGTRMPVLLIHSMNDQIVPFENAELLKEALKDDPNAEFVFGDELLHGEASVEYALRMKEFFLKWLASAPKETAVPEAPAVPETAPVAPEASGDGASPADASGAPPIDAVEGAVTAP